MDAKEARKEGRLGWLAQRCQGRVLDVGCSRSLLGVRLVEAGHDYVGVDLDTAALADTQAALDALSEEARAKAVLHELDFDRFEDADGFDTVVMAEVLEHQAVPPTFLLRAKALLRPGGRVLITTPFGWMPDPTHLQAPFASDHLDWLQTAGLHPQEVEVGDYHVRTHATLDAHPELDRAAILRATEKETEAVQRFWIAERDRNATRADTAGDNARRLQAELKAAHARIADLQRELGTAASAKRVARAVLRKLGR